MAEIRKLIWRVVWAVTPIVAAVLTWSVWRRHHQALASACHAQRRFQHLDQQVQL